MLTAVGDPVAAKWIKGPTTREVTKLVAGFNKWQLAVRVEREDCWEARALTRQEVRAIIDHVFLGTPLKFDLATCVPDGTVPLTRQEIRDLVDSVFT